MKSSGQKLKFDVMDISAMQDVLQTHLVSPTIAKEKLQFDKKTPRRSLAEMSWQKGSKILPDFFPPNTTQKKSLRQQTGLSAVKRVTVIKQYSWENEENGFSEAQTIAESWLMYYGFDGLDVRISARL